MLSLRGLFPGTGLRLWSTTEHFPNRIAIISGLNISASFFRLPPPTATTPTRVLLTQHLTRAIWTTSLMQTTWPTWGNGIDRILPGRFLDMVSRLRSVAPPYVIILVLSFRPLALLPLYPVLSCGSYNLPFPLPLPLLLLLLSIIQSDRQRDIGLTFGRIRTPR